MRFRIVNLLGKSGVLRGFDAILREELLRGRRAGTNLASNGRILPIYMPPLLKWPLLPIMTNKQYLNSINLELCTLFRATCGSRSVSTANHTKLQRTLPFPLSCFLLVSQHNLLFWSFFFALSIFFLHPAIAWQLALKWENSCKNPMSALFYFALYHIFIQSLCHFRMYWTLLLWWRKSWMLGLYTSLAMLYKLAIRVEKVGWFVSELVGGWLNCSEWSSGDILLLLLDTLSRTYFR